MLFARLRGTRLALLLNFHLLGNGQARLVHELKLENPALVWLELLLFEVYLEV